MHDDPHEMLMMNNQLHHEDCKWVKVAPPRLTLGFGRFTREQKLIFLCQSEKKFSEISLNSLKSPPPSVSREPELSLTPPN